MSLRVYLVAWPSVSVFRAASVLCFPFFSDLQLRAASVRAHVLGEGGGSFAPRGLRLSSGQVEVEPESGDGGQRPAAAARAHHAAAVAARAAAASQSAAAATLRAIPTQSAAARRLVPTGPKRTALHNNNNKFTFASLQCIIALYYLQSSTDIRCFYRCCKIAFWLKVLFAISNNYTTKIYNSVHILVGLYLLFAFLMSSVMYFCLLCYERTGVASIFADFPSSC